MGSTTTHITTIGQAVVIAALLSKNPAASSDLESQNQNLFNRLEDIKANPEGYVVAKVNGRIKIAGIGSIFEDRASLAKALKKDFLGCSGRAFHIERTDGTKFICHDIWSTDVISPQYSHLFESLVNTLVFREASRAEENAWFAEKEGF